jgi:hypothetical protein
MIKLRWLIILFSAPFLGFAQHTTKIYFIQKLDPEQFFEYPAKYTSTMKFKSAGVELYQTRQNEKVDSLFINADELYVLKDSLAFSIEVPNRFFTGSMLTISPIFYLNNNKVKGGLPAYIQGKEQSVVPIKLKIKSDPSGATVYLIPKLYWEVNSQLPKYNKEALFPYMVSEGLTTVSVNVQEYVYIAVFLYKNKFTTIQCAPNHLSPVDSIFRKLN